MEPATPKAPESGPELETRVDFLARREREKAARIAVESPVERQRRISRENQHKKFQPPGENSKIGVFVWEWDGPREVRTLLHRGQYTETWDRAKISEMHYDSIHNEWDIWKNDSANFKLGRRPMDDEDEDFYENYLASIENNEVVDNNTILAPDVGEDSFRRDVAACYGFTFEKTDGHFTGAYEIAKFLPLVDRMQDWYGFDPKAKISRWDQVRANKTLDAERLKHLLRDSITGVDKELLSAMQEFVAPLVGNMGSPGPWSDMRGRSISNFGNPDIRVLRSLYTAKEFEDPRSPSRTLFSVEIVDKYGRVQEDHHQRQFFVWDAATALAVKHFPPSSSRSFGHIAECLLEHGIPYVFAIPAMRLTTPGHDMRVPGLTPRWKDDVPDVLDFMAYLERCRELLCIGRLRKCLRYGGIIWRWRGYFLTSMRVWMLLLPMRSISPSVWSDLKNLLTMASRKMNGYF